MRSYVQEHMTMGLRSRMHWTDFVGGRVHGVLMDLRQEVIEVGDIGYWAEFQMGQ